MSAGNSMNNSKPSLHVHLAGIKKKKKEAVEYAKANYATFQGHNPLWRY